MFNLFYVNCVISNGILVARCSLNKFVYPNDKYLIRPTHLIELQMWLLVEVNECKNIFSKNQVMMFFGGVGGH